MRWLQGIIEDPKRSAFAKRLFYAIVISVVLLEILTVKVLHLGHGYFWFEDLPAFNSVYGLVSCVLIIVLAKFVLPFIVSKKDDYYG